MRQFQSAASVYTPEHLAEISKLYVLLCRKEHFHVELETLNNEAENMFTKLAKDSNASTNEVQLVASRMSLDVVKAANIVS